MSDKPPFINQNSLGQKIADDAASLKRFWRWFGNSATVDGQGRPVVFYHGSPYKFDRFNTKHVFFSTKRTFALNYAIDKSFEGGLDASPNVYDCYLRLKNPLDIGNPKKIIQILNSVGDKPIKVYTRSITLTDLKNLLEGNEPHLFLRNFDETKIGDFINPKNTESTNYQVGKDDFKIAYKTPSKAYAVRFLTKPLESFGAFDFKPYIEDPMNDTAMLSRTVKTIDRQPNTEQKLQLIISQEEAYRVMHLLNDDTITSFVQQHGGFEKLDYSNDGIASLEYPISFTGKIYAHGQESQPKKLESVVSVEIAEYTDKETARLIKSQSNWFSLETLRIGDEDFFDFLQKLGFDACYMSEDGALNVCVFNRYDIKAVNNSGQFREKGKITEAADAPALIDQNHDGEEIADNEESLRNFWRWFGKSATVDRKGRPVVFYHGTSYVFNEFTAFPIIGQMADDKAVFFSTNEEFAQNFARDRIERIKERERGVDEDLITSGALNEPNADEQDFEIDEWLYSCYVRVKNPFNPKNEKHVDAVMKWILTNVPEWKHEYFDFDLIKSKLSGRYLQNYTDDFASLRLWDVVLIPPVAMTQPITVTQHGDAVTMPSVSVTFPHSVAQIFLKGKKTALAYSIKPSAKGLPPDFPNLSRFDTTYEYTATPQQVVDLINKTDIKFNDAVSKKINAMLPVKISLEGGKEIRYETIPCHIVVWSITSKENARSKTDKTTWEEVEHLIIDGRFSFVGILKKLGFDAFYTFEDGNLNLAVFDPKNIKSAANNGKWSEQGNIYETRGK